MNHRLVVIVGIFLVLFGIYLSVVLNEPHFYTFFSVGLFLVFYSVHYALVGTSLFNGWGTKRLSLFFFLLLVAALIVDLSGIYLGYWYYPTYNSTIDWLMQYSFEFVIAFSYFLLSLIVGQNLFARIGLGEKVSFILSLVIFVTLMGLVTEYINSFSDSWVILRMPLFNYKVGSYFVLFQTVGYWLCALIPYWTYRWVGKGAV